MSDLFEFFEVNPPAPPRVVRDESVYEQDLSKAVPTEERPDEQRRTTINSPEPPPYKEAGLCGKCGQPTYVDPCPGGVVVHQDWMVTCRTNERL